LNVSERRTQRTIGRIDLAGRQERLSGPQMVQSARAVRFPLGSSLKIFEVQSVGSGDGIYDCYEQILDADQWAGTGDEPKFDDKDTTETEVLNLAEIGLEGEYVAALSVGDTLVAWQAVDDKGTKRWIGLLSGAFGRHFGVITKTLSRGNVFEGIDPESAYYVKMKSGKTDEWSGSGIDYVKDDIKQYNGEIWDCTKDHTSHIGKAPMEGSAFWKIHSDILMTVLHFRNHTLSDAIPYFQVGDVVEVCQYEKVWYILGTVINTIKSNKYSIGWDENDKRAKAVFA